MKPQRMLTREVKPTRRPQTANAQPNGFIAGTNLSNRRMRDPHVRWCGRGGEVTLPLCRLLPDLQSGDLRIKQLQFGIVLDGREHLSHDALIDF